MERSTVHSGDPVRESEVEALRRYGKRWSVLSAWQSELSRGGVALSPASSRRLGAARVKLSTGCFSSCEIGADLADVERELISTSATTGVSDPGYWTTLLARAMGEDAASAEPTGIPALRARVLDRGFLPCGRNR